MSLVFRSSTPETSTVIEREADGRQRVAVATRDYGSTRQWNLLVEHPSGQTWNGTFSGPTSDVVAALDQMLAKTEHEFLVDKARGDRPRSVLSMFDPVHHDETPLLTLGRHEDFGGIRVLGEVRATAF